MLIDLKFDLELNHLYLPDIDLETCNEKLPYTVVLKDEDVLIPPKWFNDNLTGRFTFLWGVIYDVNGYEEDDDYHLIFMFELKKDAILFKLSWY